MTPCDSARLRTIPPVTRHALTYSSIRSPPAPVGSVVPAVVLGTPALCPASHLPLAFLLPVVLQVPVLASASAAVVGEEKVHEDDEEHAEEHGDPAVQKKPNKLYTTTVQKRSMVSVGTGHWLPCLNS